MKKYGVSEMVAKLKMEGLIFSQFSLEHEGEYDVDDADWNYKDVPHLHHVHELAESIPAVIGDDLVATINLQKILGLRIPLALVNFEAEAKRQIYFTTWFFHVLIIETVYEATCSGRTKVTTTYSMGCPPLLALTFPVLRWLLKRNYQNLMGADIPMRLRRGELRKWGYRFFRDTPTYSFRKTTDITRANVITDGALAEGGVYVIDVSSETQGIAQWFVGRDDHLGLRVVRDGDSLLLYPRMCPHEGASLDQQECIDRHVKCPWHGRIFKAHGQFSLGEAGSQSVQGAGFRASYDHGRLVISVVGHRDSQNCVERAGAI